MIKVLSAIWKCDEMFKLYCYVSWKYFGLCNVTLQHITFYQVEI